MTLLTFFNVICYQEGRKNFDKVNHKKDVISKRDLIMFIKTVSILNLFTFFWYLFYDVLCIKDEK